MNQFINFEIKSNTGIIYLNRPKALNALNLEMAQLFLEKLKQWESDYNIERVLLLGEGKVFCSGGDVKSLVVSSDKQNLKKIFFEREYTLNYFISKFNKTYLSIWNGLVMGGGAGLSVHGNYRIATENTKFAMPETAIGFFPDVGSSFFLSRMPKNVGLYLGLTGEIINAYEMIYLNLATHFNSSDNIENIKTNYIKEGTLPLSKTIEKKDSIVLDNIDFIKDNFNGDILSIMKNIKNSNSKFAKKTYDKLTKRCPMSLAITVELLKKAKTLSLKECLEMEFQLCQNIVYRDDFNNGIEAVLVTKLNNPLWNPNSIYDIGKIEIENFFQTHTKKLGLKE